MHSDCIWFHIKQQITKELIRDFVCIIEIIFMITIYHYIAANKVLLNENHYLSYKYYYQTSQNSENLFSFKNVAFAINVIVFNNVNTILILVCILSFD